MTLVNPTAGHPDIPSAALALAANRASKIDLLRSHGLADMDRIADEYAEDLRRDVAQFIATSDVSDAFAERLRSYAY